MIIYIGHSKDINYIEELYKPIKELATEPDTTFILAHEISANSSNSRDFYTTIDLFIAEVSKPSTGLGIELGWAYDSQVPIVCISKKGSKIAGSLKSVTDSFFEYGTSEDLKGIVKSIIEQRSLSANPGLIIP